MQAGLADIKGWGQYMGPQWCGEGTDIERALEHSNQAVRYLISGKDDCVRKACKVQSSLASPAHPAGVYCGRWWVWGMRGGAVGYICLMDSSMDDGSASGLCT